MSSATPEDGAEFRWPRSDEPLDLTRDEVRELVLRAALGWDVADDTATGVAESASSGAAQMCAERVERRAVTRSVADIESEEVRWLWHHRVPYGMLSEICGDPGEGKSHLTLALATAVTLGAPLPGELEGTRRDPGHVLLICMEDSPEATVRPRLERMGADLTRVTILDGIRAEHGEPDPLDLSRPDHRMELRRLVEKLRVDLVVIDPVTAHLGSANEWKDSEVRSILAPLARLADATGAAILLVRHLRKSDSTRAIYRAGGSIAFTASVRSSLLVGRPDGEDTRRAVVRAKGNLSPEPSAVGYVLDDGGWGWTEAGDWTPADLLRGDTSSEERSERDEAADYLREALAAGAEPAKQIQAEARTLGISDRTLRRARQDLGVIVEREGPVGPGQRWTWRLPDEVATPSGHLDTATRGGHLDRTQAREEVSGDSDPRDGHDSHIYGQVATSAVSDDSETRCADCGRPCEHSPSHDVQRCVPCGVAAGRRERTRG